MRRSLLAILLLVLTSGAAAQNKSKLAQYLIGTWKLVSAGDILPDGSLAPFKEYGPHPIGYLMYDSTGHMCVSLANPDHPRWADPAKPTDAEKLRSADAMFAYCGTYEVQDQERRVIHRPEMSSWPHYIGTEQVRNFRLDGNRLVLSGTDETDRNKPVRYEITWEKPQAPEQEKKKQQQKKKWYQEW